MLGIQIKWTQVLRDWGYAELLFSLVNGLKNMINEFNSLHSYLYRLIQYHYSLIWLQI
jgi:hypothetical protein